MRRSSAVRGLVLACLVLGGSVAILAKHAARMGVRIDPSSTWVGMARVHLEVSELWLADSALEGRYDIRVPLLPSKNDSGTIRLELPVPLEDLRSAGGLLQGSARSSDDGALRPITCDVGSDGDIVIFVTMRERKLEFHSRYQTVAPAPADSL